MTQQGKADEALGWATMASLIGGIFSAVVLMFAAPQLARMALKFGPIETFALICLALTCITTVSRGTMIKGLFAGVLGLFLATVGTDQMTGAVRFDFGVFELTGGLSLVPVLVGLFALGEVFSRLAERITTPPEIMSKVGYKLAPLKEWLLRWRTIVKSAIIGTFIGILPGTGAATASFVSYAEAKRSGRFKEKLGTGEPEGVIASETANNAVTGGALVPTLAIGIPGDPVTAVMMGALIMQGIQPGVRLFQDNADVVYAAFVALFIANFAMYAFGAGSARIITRILKLPEPLLLSLVMVLSIVGSYGVSGKLFDVWVTFIAGIFGFIFRYCNVPTAPVVIGLVLGPIFEENLRQGLILTDNNFGAFFSMGEHPIALVLFIITALTLAWSAWSEIRSVRQPAA